MARVTLEMPLNRVEGDLDVRVTLEDNKVVEAQSIGTLYRGFENMLVGRDPLDALVITPRICGICSITHLTAAVMALEDAQAITPPPQAVRMRNLSILAETVQSDLRQVFLMFLPDFAHKFYQTAPFYEEAVRYYAPLKGEGSIEALRASKDILKVIAIIGGQWPHTSHMVPGGISTIPSLIDMTLAETHIENTIAWYEKAVLGATLESFSAHVRSVEALMAWLDEHPNTHLARFMRLCQQAGLDKIGRSYPAFISYGAVTDPNHPQASLIRAGIWQPETGYQPLAQDKICEDLTYSRFEDTPACQPPAQGTTRPMVEKAQGYTWAKAPRYGTAPMQTGPLAQALVDGDTLMHAAFTQWGDSTMVRELARLLRPVKHLRHMRTQVRHVLQYFGEDTYQEPPKLFAGEGVGLVEAARGALGHWLAVENGKISRYQIITPTAWNGSPKDQLEQPGPWEKAITGLVLQDPQTPMELGHVIRSFDPCLVCTVHALGDDGNRTRWQLGV